jgi:hypothetical protein
MKKILVVLVIMAVILVGCKQNAPTSEIADADDEVVPTEAVGEMNADGETAEINAQPTSVDATPVPTPLPIDPLNIKFLTADGVELDGEFWAGTYPETPVVVLMHQYPMDHNIEWIALAPWLQNRGLAAYVRSGGEPWADPSWFSPMIEGLDLNVFTFTFRNCLGGCSEDSVQSREEWIVDAVAAIESAASFVAVDKEKVIVLGTSIGADAAVDACARLLDSDKATCIGVVSLSPGSFLGEAFNEKVLELTNAGIPVKCIAAEGDTLSADTCLSVEADKYEPIITNGSAHGIRLFDPALNIDLPVLLQNWLVEWVYIE